MISRLQTAYDQRLAAGLVEPDPAQQRAVQALARVERDLGKKGLFGARREVRGLYLWGPPGRGKSMLMDLFYAQAPVDKKLRSHFHVFMARVHDLIRQWREGDSHQRRQVFGSTRGDDPIRPVAALIASEAQLLCFDELQVTDIGDAMILGRLFEALFEDRVVLVVTSNRAPDQLYLNGLNRQLFLPFISMIEQQCDIIEVDGAHDWRLDHLRAAHAWNDTHDSAARQAFEALWTALKGDQPEAPTSLRVQGRDLVIDRTVGSLARARFEALCERPLGPQDYLALATRFHTLFLENVPVLSPDQHQAARRFVTLIDALYEAGTRLVVLADAAPEALYPKGSGAFEFERTVSRLVEMTSADWLDRPRVD